MIDIVMKVKTRQQTSSDVTPHRKHKSVNNHNKL